MNFDYLIIGAGTAGCVLSNRLTEKSQNLVGLFEAGQSSNTWKVKIPFKYGRFNIDIMDKEGNKLTTNQINLDNNMTCHIELSNIWNFNNSYGCIWNLKKIELQN